MMRVTRDVITDLLPAYFSGEASADTRQLVEEYLANDPELAAAGKALSAAGVETGPRENAMQSLLNTRRVLRQRSFFLSFSLLFTLLPFSFGFDGQHVHWMWAETPQIAIAFLLLAAASWFAYGWTWYRVRTTGL